LDIPLIGDAYTSSIAPGANSGQDTVLKISSSGAANHRVWLKFDLTSALPARHDPCQCRQSNFAHLPQRLTDAGNHRPLRIERRVG
jgi:hypothetical protein